MGFARPLLSLRPLPTVDVVVVGRQRCSHYKFNSFECRKPHRTFATNNLFTRKIPVSLHENFPCNYSYLLRHDSWKGTKLFLGTTDFPSWLQQGTFSETWANCSQRFSLGHNSTLVVSNDIWAVHHLLCILSRGFAFSRCLFLFHVFTSRHQRTKKFD